MVKTFYTKPRTFNTSSLNLLSKQLLKYHTEATFKIHILIKETTGLKTYEILNYNNYKDFINQICCLEKYIPNPPKYNKHFGNFYYFVYLNLKYLPCVFNNFEYKELTFNSVIREEIQDILKKTISRYILENPYRID